jgi:hypothetical protein
MSLFVERKLQSELGEIEIAITQADHISARGKMEVRGAKFDCHLHFYPCDGVWSTREEDHPSITRAWDADGKNGKFNERAPKTYAAKIMETFTTVIQRFAAENAQLFVEAHDKHIAHEIEHAEAAVAKARKALQDAETELEVLYAKRRQHQLSQVPA